MDVDIPPSSSSASPAYTLPLFMDGLEGVLLANPPADLQALACLIDEAEEEEATAARRASARVATKRSKRLKSHTPYKSNRLHCDENNDDVDADDIHSSKKKHSSRSASSSSGCRPARSLSTEPRSGRAMRRSTSSSTRITEPSRSKFTSPLTSPKHRSGRSMQTRRNPYQNQNQNQNEVKMMMMMMPGGGGSGSPAFASESVQVLPSIHFGDADFQRFNGFLNSRAASSHDDIKPPIEPEIIPRFRRRYSTSDDSGLPLYLDSNDDIDIQVSMDAAAVPPPISDSSAGEAALFLKLWKI